ncbi:MAG: chemotaxis protein CheB [Desulfuromonadaceae bacterium]|nr:chemotaxis protein CheB [Desulfuromonadaceae bacterium]
MTTRKRKTVAASEVPVPTSQSEVDFTDDAPQESPALRFPIVGIGASAGGLAAFEAFFSGMPADKDPDMAFVLVQHLAPDHKSILADLVRRYTRMQVSEVEDGVAVQPNCAYIIPPGYDMAVLNGTFQLLAPSSPRGQRLPIDFFFRSLAQDQHERAICIVLSGTGSDGTQGARAIKGEGGMVMAQNPGSAEYDGMPRNVINSGVVDYILPAAEMPAQLISYADHAFGALPRPAADLDVTAKNALKKIFILLRTQTGHDFSQYKPSTINRRIERRMALYQIETKDDYVRYLQQTPTEVEALFNDLLIGVTNFFRDPEAFQVLEKEIIPRVFENKAAGGIVRVWSPGCSSGEEAYSIAILLQEHMESLKQSCTVQIFATDIDATAIATARAGLYPASIAADISPERLARFFTLEADGSAYRVNKGIRDMLIFSEQDVIKDPPFSKIDLISCRNLLIYMGGELQKKLIPLFHYALNPGGILFLGTSETVSSFTDLFDVLDRKSKLYQRRDDVRSAPRAALVRSFPLPAPTETAFSPVTGKAAAAIKPTLRELTEQALLKQVTPTAALINGKGDILYLHGHTGMYLEPALGVAGIYNILKMAREGLQHRLTIALHKAVADKELVRISDVRVKTNGHFTMVNVSIRPVAIEPTVPPETPLYLVVLEEAPPSEMANIMLPTDSDSHIAALEQELRDKEESLLIANEELEISNEELKSSNEEMQSVNEELQSTNEELVTSQEELQSVNEELFTVNAELQATVSDLSRAKSDLNNLLSGTDIGTIFVDFQLRIVHFTPAATKIINLVRSDVGRPLDHFTSNLVNYHSLKADINSVLETLAVKEINVQTTEEQWFLMRITPYHTLTNAVEGAVITFIDITEMKAAQNVMARLGAVVRDANDAILLENMAGQILAWNPAAERMLGWSESEALQMNVRDIVPEEDRHKAMLQIQALSLKKVLEPFRTRRITKSGTIVEVFLTATALVDESGMVYAIATTARKLS